MENAWQIRCILTEEEENMNNYYGDGTIGIDINYDHIAMTETDQSGNLLHHEIFRYDMEGREAARSNIRSRNLSKRFFNMQINSINRSLQKH